ncbi:MAG: CvpA family protein [Bdellovibrionales bacterium]
MVLDILVLIVLLISAGIAFMRGFIREVLTIAGVVGGLAAAYFFGPLLKPHMRGWFGVQEGEDPQKLFDIIPYDILADAVSYGSIFIVVVILLSLTSHFLAESAKAIGLGAVDRSLGFVFGIIRGVLVLGVLYMLPYFISDKDTRDVWFEGSKSQFYLEKTAGLLASYLPDDAQEQAKTAADGTKELMNTREKLEQIDLLQSRDQRPDEGGDQQGLSDPVAIEPQSGGYDEEFRDRMDALFEHKTRSELNE